MDKYKDHMRKCNEDKMKKVACFLDGELVKVYDNICQTVEDGFDYSHASKVANGIRKKHLGHTFQFVE